MTLGEKYINRKIIAKQIIACSIFIILLFGSFFVGHVFTIRKIGETSFTESKTIEVPANWENPYKGLIKDEITFYIIEVCKSLKLNPNLPIAILLQENSKQDPYAVNINNNGTTDNGLFQINSAYLLYFANLYWPFNKYNADMSFDWSNWQHNSWVAIHLINDLYKDFDGNIEKTIMAYNAGASAVISGDIPKITLDYRDKVLNNYTLLSSL